MREEILAMSRWMTLSETVPYMCNGDPFDRMKGEALQLQIRMTALIERMKKGDDPLLGIQYSYMKKYFDVLMDRMENMENAD